MLQNQSIDANPLSTRSMLRLFPAIGAFHTCLQAFAPFLQLPSTLQTSPTIRDTENRRHE